jgi:hypothetical protein
MGRKMRFSGLFILVIALLSMAGIWMMGVRMKPAQNTIQGRDIVALISRFKVSSAEMEKVQVTASQVDSLIAFRASENDYSELIGVPPQVHVNPLAISTTVETKSSEVLRHKYLANMVFMAPGDRYAVVDGYFAREGDFLPNGGEVMSISQGKVLIKDAGVVQTVVVAGSMPKDVLDGKKHVIR